MALRLALVTSDFPPRIGGIATFAEGLVEALRKNDHVASLRLIVAQGKEVRREEVNSRYTKITLPKWGGISTSLAIVRELIRARGEFDVVHVLNVYPWGFVVSLLGRLFRFPVVLSCYGTDVLSREGSAFTRWAKRFAVRHTRTIAISEGTKEAVESKLGLKKDSLSVAYYPLPKAGLQQAKSQACSALGYTADDVIVLTVGNLVRRKGTLDLVEAFTKITNPRVKLVIVGEGPLHVDLEQHIQKYGLSDRVSLAGRVSDVSMWYDAADVFVLASYFIPEEGDLEGLGIVLLQAAQHRLPVIGTKSGGIPETMVDGKTGFLISERDTQALAEKIEQLAAAPALRMEMGEQGSRFVQEQFDPTRVASDYVRIYRSVTHHV